MTVFGAAVGALLILGFEELREPLYGWVRSEPAETARRARLILLLSAALLAVPAIVTAVYLWRLGARVLRARQFPPPGFPVIRDTAVLGGDAAATRGYAIQVLALCLGLGATLLCLFFWWVTGTRV